MVRIWIQGSNSLHWREARRLGRGARWRTAHRAGDLSQQSTRNDQQRNKADQADNHMHTVSPFSSAGEHPAPALVLRCHRRVASDCKHGYSPT